MKPGDKVWWFDARTQTIECEEALCEHYKKIFE